MHIPKLFFFDACRGSDKLYAALSRGKEEKEVNYRIECATIPGHVAPGRDQWMQLVAKTLRDKDVEFGILMEEVRQKIYSDSGMYIQLPETTTIRLTTGPLKLWYKKQ
jgi:hypothetical protein